MEENVSSKRVNQEYAVNEAIRCATYYATRKWKIIIIPLLATCFHRKGALQVAVMLRRGSKIVQNNFLCSRYHNFCFAFAFAIHAFMWVSVLLAIITTSTTCFKWNFCCSRNSLSMQLKEKQLEAAVENLRQQEQLQSSGGITYSDLDESALSLLL